MAIKHIINIFYHSLLNHTNFIIFSIFTLLKILLRLDLLIIYTRYPEYIKSSCENRIQHQR